VIRNVFGDHFGGRRVVSDFAGKVRFAAGIGWNLFAFFGNDR
jgi:hypothetical protein